MQAGCHLLSLLHWCLQSCCMATSVLLLYSPDRVLESSHAVIWLTQKWVLLNCLPCFCRTLWICTKMIYCHSFSWMLTLWHLKAETVCNFMRNDWHKWLHKIILVSHQIYDFLSVSSLLVLILNKASIFTPSVYLPSIQLPNCHKPVIIQTPFSFSAASFSSLVLAPFFCLQP